MNYTLTYRKNKSQVIYVEEIEKIEESGEKEQQKKQPYFKQEYDEALKLIAEIIELQKNGNEIEVYGCNNRILFTGPRGCGKTSVMRSIANYLSKPEAKLKDKDGNILNVKFEFNCLPMVDPSHFDNNNNILLTVITNMFSEAKRKMNKAGDQGETADREDLLKQFEKVFKSLDSIKSEVQSYTLESLNRKSDAEDLRDKMNQLVAKYLKYLNQGKDAKLVLLIDDIDMSVSHAPGMLEQLRKYLELDNLIILMSANLGQLSNEMREKYSSAFQNTLKDSNQSLSIDVEDLATKYLLKLFPTSRRVNVERHVNQLLQTELIISEATNEDHGNGEKGKERIIVSGDFQKVILSLIWRKTRLLFIPKDPGNTLHPIIPTNLRDLAQFLDMLTDLSDVGYFDKKKGGAKLFADDEAYRICEKNIQEFKGYVMNTWIPNRLTVDEEKVFENIPTDITEINKHLINSINVIGTQHKTRLMSREVSLDMIERNAENINIDRDIYTMVSPNDPKFVKANKISDIFNQPSNYSYGDLLLMIDKYETYFESEEDRRFTDAIKIYYSILLFETMFYKSQHVDYEYEKLKGDKPKSIPIQRLIGGNVYYPNYFEIITDKDFNQKGPSFDAKRAFYHKVKVDGDKMVGDSYPLFSVLYYGDIRPDRYEKDHIYDTTFKKNAEVDGVNYVTFDILSVLNNMLNPCQTLSRLDDDNFWPKTMDSIKLNILEWGKQNRIDGKSIPNAVLPFYAVDFMLSYLRYDCSTQDLFEKNKLNTDKAKDVANSVSFFFEDSSSMMNSILYLLKFIVPNKEICETLKTVSQKKGIPNKEKKSIEEIAEKQLVSEKDLAELKKNIKKSSLNDASKKELKEIESKTFIGEDAFKKAKDILKKEHLSEEDRNELNDIISKGILSKENINKLCNNMGGNNDRCRIINKVCDIALETSADDLKVLIDNLEVIIAAHEGYRKASLCDDCNKTASSEFYRNRVEALVLGKALMSKKEREALVKELRKFSSVTEIYKHIVDVLWENKIKEMCIRGKIQEKVRSFEVVQKYYRKLWKETKKMFELIDCVNPEADSTKSKTAKSQKPVDVYESLFEEATNLFLSK